MDPKHHLPTVTPVVLPKPCLPPTHFLLLTFSRRIVLAVWDMTSMASPFLWRSMKIMPLSQQAQPTVPMYRSSFLAMGTQRLGMTSTMPGGWMGREESAPAHGSHHQPQHPIPTLSLRCTHSPELSPTPKAAHVVMNPSPPLHVPMRSREAWWLQTIT